MSLILHNFCIIITHKVTFLFACDLSPCEYGPVAHVTLLPPKNRLYENTKLEAPDPPLSQTIVRCKITFSQMGSFSRMRRLGNVAHEAGGGNNKKRKTKFTHKATPARCASQYTRSCCIFLGSYMLSFDTQRSHGVRDAPSHGNSPGGAFTRCKTAR